VSVIARFLSALALLIPELVQSFAVAVAAIGFSFGFEAASEGDVVLATG